MELRQLRYFVKVAELKNFSSAARLLNITQSTLSQQIRQLEQELGVELLIRDSRHVELNDMGKVFLPSARRTLQEANTCIERIHDVQGLRSGTLNIGVTFTFSKLLKESVITFLKKYPDIQLNICCYSMEELMEKLKKGEIDLALSYKPSINYEDIDSHILFDNHLSVIMRKGHPLANKKLLRFQDLEDWRIALPAKGLQARNAFDRIVNGQNYYLNVCLEVNDADILLDLAASSDMITLLSSATSRHNENVIAVPLDYANTDMEGCFHILKNAYMKHTTKEFLRLLCENKIYDMTLMDILQKK